MRLLPALFTLPLLTGAALAGPASEGPIAPTETAKTSWLKPTIDARIRYEYRNEDGLGASNALTARARVGLLLGEFEGFSAFGELEGTYALVDDYDAGGGADPINPGQTGIPDPENIELNRAWLQYQGHGATIKAGRQRILRNNAAFIGNVGWRQNEQTFDAVSLAYERDAFNLYYAYSNRAQRIFGDDAVGAAKEFEGDFHFIEAGYDAGEVQVTGYAYLVDIDNNMNVGRSNTFGAYATYGPLYVEAAFQDGTTALNGMGDYDAWYGHAKVSKKLGGATYGAGIEYLEDYFKTPFATVHAFGGFADAFVGQRVGLNDKGGAYDGIADVYLSYVRPDLPGGITLKAFGHWFLDDEFGDTYGYEADLVLAKKINDNLTILVEGAYFWADSGSGYADIAQATVEANITF